MNDADLLLAKENPDLKYVQVLFAPYTGMKTYTYKTLLPDVAVGDDLIVKVKNDTEYKVVRVESILEPLEADLNPNIGYAWVVQRVELPYLEYCLSVEMRVHEQLRKQRNIAKNTEAMARL